MEKNGRIFTEEQIEKSMACQTVEELLALAEKEGVALTREEAEGYLEELSSVELSAEEIDEAAGGRKKCNGRKSCPTHKSKK